MNTLEQKKIKLLKRHEGLKLHPYKCTANKTTIGIGRNLDDRGISAAEAETLLKNDIQYFEKKLNTFEWYISLDDIRKLVILNMAFNLGINGVCKFKNMIKRLAEHDFINAAKEMVESRWAIQVKNRALELAWMMEHGRYLECLE